MTLPSPVHFTDRQEALAAYDALWVPGTSQRVLNIEGISGNGKSTLLWYIDKHHPKPADRLHLTLDMANESLRTGDYTLLDLIARQLREWLPRKAFEAYDRQRKDALDQASAIRKASVQIKIDQHAEGGGSIADSSNTVVTEVNRRLADLRRQAPRGAEAAGH